MDRIQLFDALSNLSPHDFERLLVSVNMPRMNRAGASAKIGEQVSALLEWADSEIGPGVDEIEDCLNKLQNGTLRITFDFSGYLKAVCEDPRFQPVRDLYTETEVLIPLEAETVEKKSSTADSIREDQSQQQKVERFPVLEGLRKYALGDRRQHLLLAGRPGSGKSTTLKRLLLEQAEAALDQPELVPVYVQLKGDRPIADLIIAEFRRAKVRVTSEQIDEWLFNDQLLLLLDGINEIPSKERRDELDAFREDNLTTPMIFTIRDLAVGGDLGIEKWLEMRPLSETQMREFVQKYLPNHADKLLHQLKDRLREVAETPLLLKMLCDVFDPATEQIPQSKGELFRLFDSKYDRFKSLVAVSDDFRRFKPELLQHLAFCMLQGDPANPTEPWLTLDRNRAEKLLETYLTGRIDAPGQRAKEWLEDLLEHHLLQVATDPREIEFHHQLFQEYYAAEALLQKLPELLQDEVQFKRDYLNLLKWTEPIALMLAVVDDEAQALRVVKLAMDDIDLMFGARLAGEVKPDFQEKTVNWVASWTIPPSLKIELLTATRSKAALLALRKALEDEHSNRITRKGDALEKIGIEEGIRSSSLTTQKFAQAFDKSLVIREREADAKAVRLRQIENITSELAVPELLQMALESREYDVRKIAAKTLVKISNQTGQSLVPRLLQVFKSNDLFVRSNAAQIMSYVADGDTMQALFQELQNYILEKKAVKPKTLDNFEDEIVAEYDVASAIDGAAFLVNVATALEKVGSPILISQLWQMCLADEECLLLTIVAIQKRCKFYNYEVIQDLISPGKTISLYFSYACADEILQTQLAKHLALLERQGVITSWSSHQILPGSDRTQTIHQQLNTADIILLLISPDAIADDTCYHLEIQRAIERHQSGEARVIPILLRPVDWQGAPFSQLDVLPKNHQPVTTWPNPDEAFREIAEGIRTVAMEVRKEKGGG